MVNTGRKTLFLTGAPSSSSLKWTEADLSAVLQHCFLKKPNHHQPLRSTSFDSVPSWRLLPVETIHLPTGFTQASREDAFPAPDGNLSHETSFFSASEMPVALISPGEGNTEGSLSNAEELLSQFYEHSFTVHDEIPSSDIVSAGSILETSFNTEAEEYSFESIIDDVLNSQDQVARSRLVAGCLSEIRDIPNAGHLRSITPQTMTVNLVVGIMSISKPRIIKTCKGDRAVELVEMLVGDETRAGFGINIWLPSTQETKYRVQEAEELRVKVSNLRPQDIVLVRNVALSSFRGKVHGQSLRRGMTTVDLLYRNTIDMEDVPGAFRAKDLEHEALTNPQILKVKQVKEWVMQFVAGANTRPPTLSTEPSAHIRKKPLRSLPSDTQ